MGTRQATASDADAKQALTGLAEFAHFQSELRQNLVEGPDAVKAELVGATFDWF